MSTSFVLLLLFGTAFAATHVNISIAQQPITNPADVTYIDGKAPADLKAGPQDEKHQVEFILANDNDNKEEKQTAKLQEANKQANFYYVHEGVDEAGHSGQMQNSRFSSSEGRLARVQLAESQEQKQQDFNAGTSFNAQANGGHHQEQPVYNRGLSQRQRHSQLRQHQEQEKKNQEFERYIQQHHSGPTVETVFETSDPAPQRYQEPGTSFSHSTASSSSSSSMSSSSSSPSSAVTNDNSRLGRIQKFERQVALPAAVTQVLPSVDAERQSHTIAIQQPKPIVEPSQENVVVHTASVSRDSHNSGHSYPDQTQYGLSAGYDKTKIDQASSYDKTNYGQGSGYDKNNNAQGSSFDKTNTGQASGYDKNLFSHNSGQVSSYDQKNFGQGSDYNRVQIDQAASYDKTNFDQNNFNYNAAQHPSPQYPPTVDEHQGGYGGYNSYGGYYGSSDQSNFYGSQQPRAEYYPGQSSYQHPVVTKTIQIAQPALKAKKFEVRHPAIQKEFYDIEERVVIKPAGTVVVELDHPVAKIPRGETILPLGHPHPAVANQYHDYNAQAGAQQHFSNAPGSGYGSSSRTASGANYNNQYSSSAVHSPKPMRDSTTIASSITSTPSHDHSAKGAIVEANLNGQFNEETLFVPATEQANKRVEEKPEQDAFYVATDSHGHQRQISSRNLSPKMFSSEVQENRYPAHIEVKNRAEPSTSYNNNNNNNNHNNNDDSHYAYVNEERRSRPTSSSTSSAVQTDSSYNGAQYNYSSNNDQDQFQAEYFNGALNNNAKARENFKPARLRESPVLEETHSNAMKHEHKITLPPVQHTLYLTRSEQSPLIAMQQVEPKAQIQQSPQQKSARYEEETAHVMEIKPYLQQHRDSVMVYATPTKQPSARYSSDEGKSQRLTQSHNSDVQIDQHRGQLRSGNEGGLSHVQYSAPYSQMRHHPEHSARLTYNKLYVIENNKQSFAYDRTAGGDKANLKVANDDKESLTEDTKTIKSSEDTSAPITKTSEHHASAHIQIQLPHHPEETGKPIIINSAIHPPQSHHSQEQTAKYRTTSSISSSADGNPKNHHVSKQLDLAHFANLESVPQTKPDCEPTTEHHSARYETVSAAHNSQQPTHHKQYIQQKFMRLVEAPEASSASANLDSSANVAVASVAVPLNKPSNIDTPSKSAAGHVATPGSRVIASTSASTDASSHSESFHKRRIVVNHPFQTVREVVEHEPITNYHQVQVKEPAPSAHYRTPYIQTHGALIYQSAAPATHGNLRYSAPVGVPLHDSNASYNDHN